MAPATTVLGLVQQQLQGTFAADPAIRNGDGVYYLPTLPEVEEILQSSEADRREWMKERFDCDDFAYVVEAEMSSHAYHTNDLIYGVCVGMLWGNFDWLPDFHAVNWFLAPDGLLRFIEPQTDAIYDASRCHGGISLLLV